MNKIILLLFVVFSKFSLYSQNPDIFNGNPIDITEVPWIVSVEIENEHHCAGSIINEQWVLSAAHCYVEYLDSTIYIHAGSTNQELNHIGQRLLVDSIIIHPQFDADSIFNGFDLALLRLNEPLCFNDSVQAITYATPDNTSENDILPFTQVRISGWGDTGVLQISPVLLTAVLPIISDEEANEAFPTLVCSSNVGENPVDSNQIAIFLPPVSAGRGDSGGPGQIIINGEPRLIGIISWGGCPRIFYPSVLSDVRFLSDFITTNIEDPDSCKVCPGDPLLSKCDVCLTGEPENITISTSQIFTDSIIDGNLLIKAPAVVTINNRVVLTARSEITVEMGAKLIIDGGTLTSCANVEKWKGIRAIGNPFMISQNITSVEIKNGAIIENAVTGINTSNLVFGGLFGALNYSGAKITVDNSSILNCNTGINMGPFGYYDVELFPGYNISSEDESYIQDAYIQAKVGIRLNGNRGFEVKENTTIQHDVSTHPVGIWATNSKFSVDKTEFTGMNYPIVSTYSYPYPEGSVISESMFDSPTMIHWDNNSNLVSRTLFHENDFENGGIFIVGDNLFDIKKNSFYDGSSAVEVVGTGALNETYIINNKFDGPPTVSMLMEKMAPKSMTIVSSKSQKTIFNCMMMLKYFMIREILKMPQAIVLIKVKRFLPSEQVLIVLFIGSKMQHLSFLVNIPTFPMSENLGY